MEHIDIYSRLVLVPLCEDTCNNFNSFTVRKDGGFLADYLKFHAVNDEINHYARTYIIRDVKTDTVVAYFSIKAGFVAMNIRNSRSGFDSIPGVEISNFAVNQTFIEEHPSTKGIGKLIFLKFIIPKIKEAQKFLGIRFIYIFALPHQSLIEYYESWGFSRLNSIQQEKLVHKRIRPNYDKDCIFMYQIL